MLETRIHFGHWRCVRVSWTRSVSLRRHVSARLLCWMLTGLLPLMLVMLSAGCQAPRNFAAIHAYYGYEYDAAREALRPDALTRNDEQVLLNNARLGMAALAAGDLAEAERALGYSFELLSTAGLNADRTTAAIMLYEGVRIWKGEPFEQAMMYHYVATLYAIMGDWENARAASANALFRLTDFGAYQTPELLARRAAADDEFLDRGYTAVDTNFALGFLMQGIGARLSGAGGSDAMFDAAVEIDPSLASLAQTLREDAYNTLLIVHYGKGPTKIAYGPANALARFQQQEPLSIAAASLSVQPTSGRGLSVIPVANISRMAMDHRWNNLEDIRRAKAAIGEILIGGGAVATYIGIEQHSAEVALAGVGAMILGMLTQAGARADTRYLEFLPQSVYLVPLQLDGPGDVRLTIGDGRTMTLYDLDPGEYGDPKAVYVRMHGRDSPPPRPLGSPQRNATSTGRVTGN